MKISKKILGVALVVIMVLNVFAVGVFAAFPTDTAVKLALRADKTNYAKGETITLTFSEQVISEIGEMRIGGQYDMGYNGSVFELISDATDETGALDKHGFSKIQAGYDSGISGVQIPSSSGVSSLYDWSTAVTWNVGDDTTTTFAATEMTDLFTVQIKVKDDAPEGTYTIGFNPAGYEGYSAYSNDGVGYGGLYGVNAQDADFGYSFSVPNMYEFGTCTITVGNGGPTSQTATVANKDVQTQWSDKANGILKLGFRGTIANYDHTTDLVTGSTTKLAKLAEVGVVFSKTDSTPTRAEIGSTCTDAPAYAIYSFTTGEYYFRAVVDNVPATGEGSTDPIYANAYIKYNGQYYEATNTVLQTTGATQYADKDMANKD